MSGRLAVRTLIVLGLAIVLLPLLTSGVALAQVGSTPLSVTVSGPGRVTSGDGRIDCPGNCSELYDTTSMVTLTALPEGGGSFRGWSGACGGPQAMCILTLDAAKSVTAVFAGTEPPPAGLALYDDFNAASLDPTRWAAQRESLRLIQNGALVLAHRSGADSDDNLNTQLRHVNPPTNLTSLQADVTLTAATPPTTGGYSRLRIRGAFYNDGTQGTGSTGDVWANAGLRLAAGGTPEAWWSIARCADADCAYSTNSAGGALGPVPFNQGHIVRIAWNGSQFTFSATPVGGGTPLTQSVTPPLPPVNPPRSGNLRLRAEVTALTSSPGVLDGYTAGTFDNVYVNDILYDNFSGGTIDPSKWMDFEWGRTVQTGALVLNAQAPATKGQYTSIRVPNPNSVTEMAVDMALTARSLTVTEDRAHAGLQGAFYNTGTGTLLGDVHGQIYYWTSGDDTVSVHFNTWRSDNAGQFIPLFGEVVATGLTMGELHQLRLGWDGAVFTYGVDGLLRTFDPRPLAPVGRAPVNPSREVYAQANAGAGGRAALTASVENLWVNPGALAALPALRPFQTLRLAGDVATAGVGLRGTGSGVINLRTLPANATVQQAWLYWATLGSDGTFTNPTLNGVPVSGTLIGQGDDPNVGAWQSYAYRAEVTELVSGNESYLIAGLPADGPTGNDTEGASLVVLYTVPGAPLRQVAINDGLATLTYSNTLPIRLLVAAAPFAGLEAVTPAGATLTLLVGDGEVTGPAGQDSAGLNATLLTPGAEAFTGSAGPAWDTLTLDASSALAAGATEAAAILSTRGDSLVWVAALLSTPLQSPALSVSLAGSGTGTATSSPVGISCPGDCSQTYTSGTQVTLTATASSGSTFAGWSGACGGTGACQVTVNAAKSVTATFGKAAPIASALTVSLVGSGMGTVTSTPAGITCPGDCTETYPLNSSVTLTASTGTNSAFLGWGGACAGLSMATCTVAVDVAKSVTATFVGATDTAAALGLRVSGPGRVTSGDGRIDCPGNCTELYGKNTTVTLTASPEGGGSFRGWSGACGGPQAMCALTLDQAKGVTAVFTSTEPLPASLALYDDFSTPHLDPARWASVRESVREIQNGVLVLAHSGAAASDTNTNTQFRHANPPTNLTSLQAVVTLSDTSVPVAGAWNRMRLRGAFYNDGTGTGMTGDVRAHVGLRVGLGGAPEAYYGLYRCADADCNTTSNGLSGALGLAAFNTPYTVKVAWTGTQFTFTATPVGGGTPLTQTVTPPVSAAGVPRTGEVTLRAEVSAWTSSPGVLDGYTQGTFDNVYINGSLYDNFTGPAIDSAKWRDYEIRRTLTNGALVQRVVAPPGTPGLWYSLRFPNPNAVTTIQADVALTAAVRPTATEWGQAGLRGKFYTMGTGTTGGEVMARVYYSLAPGDSTISAQFNVWRSEGPQYIELFTDTLATGLALGESHRFLLGWDGEVFTYGVDGLVRRMDPRPLAPPVGPPLSPLQELYVNAGSGGSTAELVAAFDNIRVNPEAFAALPALRPFRTLRLAGGVATAGVGLRGTGAGTITLGALPANAMVQHAFLYWAILGVQDILTSPTLNGDLVAGELIGHGDDPVWGAGQSRAYRAEVTSLIPGNGSYVIAGLPANGPTLSDTEGATLVVLYTVPGAPLRQVAISDGLAALTSGRLPVAQTPFAGLEAIEPVGATLTLLVGDGEVTGPAARDFAGLNTTVLTPTDAFTGSAGPVWDTLTLDASTAVTAGATDASAVLSTWGDSLVWVAALLSTPVQSPALSATLAGPGTGTVTSSPAGLNCPGDCSQTYPSGTQVTLTATASSGSTFAGWSGACGGTGLCQVTVNAAKSVTATFGKTAPTASALTVSLPGSGMGAVTSTPAGITCPGDCSESYAPTTSVTLTASAGTNSAFLGWGGACAGLSSPTCTVAMEVAKSVTATFAGTTDTAAVLSVLVSGPGRVSTGDGKIDCPGNCSELFGKNTMVTLTALPEGGGSFRGWSGACGGPQAMCALTLDQAKSVTAGFTGTAPPPAGLALYDDFSAARLDPTKWSSVREQVREIRNGKLFMAAGGSAPSDNSANTPLRHVNPPTNLTSLRADLRLTEATPPVAGGFSRMRIRAAFYSDGTAGTGSLGDVWAQVGIRVYPTGAAELYWGYFRCDDADCSLSPTGETGVLGPAALNTTYTVSIAWNAAANAGAGQFTFTATPEGGNAITHTRTPIITPKGSPRTGHLLLRPEATTWTTSPGILEGYTAGTFDNVYINGTLYDDFSGPAIDPAKWRDYEVVRELTHGATTLRSVTPAGKGGQSSQLRLPNPNAVTALAADMALTAISFGNGADSAQAGLRATLYNTGTGTPLGDVQAEVKYWTNGSGPGNLQLNLYRSEGSQYISIFNDTLVPSFPLNESHRLLLGWDGAVISYGVDSLVRTLDPRPAAPVAQPPVNPNRVLFVNTNSGGGSASLTAVFDNVAVNPEALSALPGLHPRQTKILAGDVAAAGVGLRRTGAGTLSLSALPPNATVTQATLYWATLGRDGTFTSPTLNGTPVTGTLIGQGDDPIGGAFQTYAYRADVTDLVTGNGSYLIAGLPADAPTLNDTEGASLVVLYTVPGAPLRQIAVSDGVATLTSNILGTQAPIPIPARLPVARAPFADLRAIDPAGAKLLLLAGDGRPSGTLTRDYAGLDGTLLASDPFTGSDGADWDTKLLDASTALTAGATTATAVVSTLADSVVWVAAILSTPLQSPTLSVTLSGSGTVTSGPAGISCPGDCSQTYAYGTPVTLTATASGGLVFGSWTDCPSPSGNKCTVTMDQAWSVGASFVPPTQTLTVTIGGSSGGSVSSNPSGLTCSPTACTGSFPNGTLVTLTATRDSGGTFREWRGACTGATCQVTMNGPKSVTAVFSKAFTDSTLTTSIPIKVVHFTELREAINTLRARCVQCVPVLGSFAWTDSNLVPRSTPVKTAHLTELRTALAPVYRQKYGKDPIYTTDPSVIAGQTIIKAIHLNALRQFVRDSE